MTTQSGARSRAHEDCHVQVLCLRTGSHMAGEDRAGFFLPAALYAAPRQRRSSSSSSRARQDTASVCRQLVVRYRAPSDESQHEQRPANLQPNHCGCLSESHRRRFHRVQPIVHACWALTALTLIVVSLVREPATTYLMFSYWSLTLHVALFGYLALGQERQHTVYLVRVRHHQSGNRWRWQASRSGPGVALLWSVVCFLSFFIALAVVLLAALVQSDTQSLTAAYAAEQLFVHGVPLLALLTAIGLPLFRVPFFWTSGVAALLLGAYLAVLAAAQTTFFAVYSIPTAAPGVSDVSWLTICLVFLVVGLATELNNSDLMQPRVQLSRSSMRVVDVCDAHDDDDNVDGEQQRELKSIAVDAPERKSSPPPAS